MKLSKLLVLSSLGLVSLSAGAADLIERTAPEAPTSGVVDLAAIDKTPVDFVIGDAYVMYNTGSSMYYYRGNAWSTQASGNADQALLVRFVQSNTEGSLWLRDWDDRDGQLKWRTAFITTGDSKACTELGLKAALFVDNNDGDAALMKVTDMGGKVYRISVSDKNSATTSASISTEGTYFAVTDLSYDGDGMGGNAIDPVATEGNMDWQFYAVPEWTDYFHALDLFNKAEELKINITSAEAAGIDVNAAADVYNNEESTLAQIEAAITALKKAISDGISNGTASNPTDATAMLLNPNFDNASSAGWSGTAPNMAGDGNHAAANVAEHYNKTFDTYQELSGLPAGVYALSASTFFRGTWADHVSKQNYVAFLYGTSADNTQTVAFNNPWDALNTKSFVTEYGETTEFGTPNTEGKETHDGVAYYIPNNPSTARLYFEDGLYATKVFFASDGTARVGVKKESKVTDSDWCVFDNFKLEYYGNTAESFQAMVKGNAPDFTGGMITTSLIEDYNGQVETLSAGATDKESAIAAIEQIKALVPAIQANAALWAQWVDALAKAEPFTQGDYANLMAAAVLGEYFSFDAEEQKAAPTWDDATIQAEIEHIAQMVQDVKDELNQNVTAGTDVTDIYLTNADFNNGNTGWTDHVTDSRPGIAFRENICEAYDTSFDMYQEVVNPQVGVYELQLQGFFRMGRDAASYNSYTNGEQKTTAGVYINDNKTYLKCIFDDGLTIGSDEETAKTGGWMNNEDNFGTGMNYPNDMTSAAYAFGLKDDAGNGKYYVNSAYGLVANPGETMRLGVGADIRGANWICWDNFRLIYRGFDASVIKPILDSTVEGLDLSKPMGKSVYAEATAAVAAAKAASDGDAMFQALKDLFAARNKVEASVALFQELNLAVENLGLLMTQYTDNETAVAEAGEFYERVIGGIADHQYEDSDVEDLLIQVKVQSTHLRLPLGYEEASELNPIEVTAVIETPEFSDDEGSNSVYGWNAQGYNFGNDDTQKSALLLEFYNKAFDLNQTIYGLPNGAYEVKVSAFARLDEAKTNPVYLYANNNQTEVQDLMADSGIADMVSASAAFESGEYLNTVMANVTDGTLKIGIKKETNDVSTGDWVIMDNWKLTFLGGDVVVTEPGDVNKDGAVDVADISNVITIMAEGTNDPAGDVNKDGAVDVADISNIITIMAEKARMAKAAIGE